MDFVDDVDLFPTDTGGKIDLVAQFADVVDGGVGCRIDLNEIEELSVIYGLAVGAMVAGPVFKVFIQAVHSPRKDPGYRCFSCTPGAGEKICMSDTVRPDRVLQDPCYLFLIYNVVPNLRTIFSV